MKVTRVRRALLKDLNAINELTFKIHQHLGSHVGIKFSLENLKHEMYQTKEDAKNVYVAELDGKSWATCPSPTARENEFFSKHHYLYHTAVKQEHNSNLFRSGFIDVFAMTYNQQKYYVSLNLVENPIISQSQRKNAFPLTA